MNREVVPALVGVKRFGVVAAWGRARRRSPTCLGLIDSQDVVDGYGYPQLTEQAKRKILGENLLRLHGMDVEATVGAGTG